MSFATAGMTRSANIHSVGKAFQDRGDRGDVSTARANSLATLQQLAAARQNTLHPPNLQTSASSSLNIDRPVSTYWSNSGLVDLNTNTAHFDTTFEKHGHFVAGHPYPSLARSSGTAEKLLTRQQEDKHTVYFHCREAEKSSKQAVDIVKQYMNSMPTEPNENATKPDVVRTKSVSKNTPGAQKTQHTTPSKAVQVMKNDNLNKTQSNLDITVEKMSEALTKLSERQKNSDETHRKTMQAYNELEKKYANLDSKHKTFDAKCTTLQTQNSSLNSAHKALTIKNQELEKRNEGLGAKIRDLQQEHTKTKRALSFQTMASELKK